MNDDLVRDLYERMGRMEAKIDDIRDIRKTANIAKDTAEEALTSTKSAHKRLDKVDKIIWWVSTSIIGTVIVALLALIIKNQG